jgi:predicted RND superfamily exporter protein
VAAPIIVLTVAIADGVHITLSVMAELRAGRDRKHAVAHSIEHHLEAVTYTWLTTIVGFLCLNYSDAPPVRHLANMTSVGVTVAYLLSISFLPALLLVLPVRAPRQALRGGLAIPAFLPDLVIRWRKPILAATAVITVATGLMAVRLSTNDLFIQYFSSSLQFRKDADFTMQHLSGLYRVEFLLDAGAPAGVTQPEYLHDVEHFTDWLRAQPEVDHVYSLTDVLRRVNQVANGGAPSEYRIAETQPLVSEDLLLYEMNLPAGLDLTDRISVDKSASRLSITIKDLSTRQLNAFVARSEGWLHANAPKPMWAHATGPVVIFSQMSERNARNMVQADFLSLGIILLCMVVLLRSWSLGIVSVILNVVPIIVGYGIWWMVVGDMNIVATIAASISLGIIVDDTIHFLTKYRQLRKDAGRPAEAAIRETMIEAGPAMMATGLILCLGFGVLTLSSFQMTSHLGWLSLIIIAIAPLTDLFVTPALVMWREPLRKRSRVLEKPIAVSGHVGSGQWIVRGGIES